MTRTLKALLIGIRDSGWSKNPVEQAVPTIAAMQQYLTRRFENHAAVVAVLTDRDGEQVTNTRVKQTLAALALTPEDLFVLVFFGHGLPATDDVPRQAWALSGRELYTDEELYEFIQEGGGEENVVISACCYARGFLARGSLRTDRHRRNARRSAARAMQRFFDNLALRVKDRKPSRFVLVSAADVTATVDEVAAPEILALVRTAADGGETYRALRRRFEEGNTPDRHFYVDARPRWRSRRRVLAL